MKASAKKNYVYNLIFQLVNLLVPFLIAPYLSRVLTVEGTGQYSFVGSIVNYFVLFASFGFSLYGQREIAKANNKYEKSKILYEIFILRILFVLVCLGGYFIIIFCNVLDEKYFNLSLIMSILIFSVIFDIAFFFQGNEDFKKIAIRNCIIKIINVVLIFLLVKSFSDLWKYGLIMVLSTFVSNLSLFPYLRKNIEKVKFKELNFMCHLKPALILFIPSLASSVYIILDKSLIGFITQSDIENGYYEQADKIMRICMTILSSLGIVMMSRNSTLDLEKDYEEFNHNIVTSFQFVGLVGFPMSLGLLGIAQNFCPWFFGEGYDKVPYILMILSPLIFITGISNVVAYQILLPQKKDIKMTIPVCCGAIVNLLANLLLIRGLLSYGAAIGSIIAELVVTILTVYFGRKSIQFSKIIPSFIKYLIFSCIMFVGVFIGSYFLNPSIWNTILLLIGGGFLYSILLLIFRDKLVMNLITNIKNKLIKNKQI